MAQPALKISPQEDIEELSNIFEQKLAQIEKLKKEIQTINARIKLMHQQNKEMFNNDVVDLLALKIDQLRKSLKATEVEVQLLSRAVAFGK